MVNKKLAYEKLEELKKLLASYESVLVAFSGGVDSSFLLKVSHDVLKDKAIAVFSSSILNPLKEKEDAKKIANLIGSKLIVIERDIFLNKDFMRNDKLRCYYCKKDLVKRLKNLAKNMGINEIVEGSNSDDLRDYRPGRRALEEEGIKSPLSQVGFTKEEIRFLSQELELPTFNKPSMACLITRIPYGAEATKEKFTQIEKAENVLYEKGFYQVRVRHHGEIARIEISRDEIVRFFDLGLIDEITKKIKDLGFKFVTLDLSGYKQGSLN